MIEIRKEYYRATEKLLYSYKVFQVNIENMQSELEEMKSESHLKGVCFEGEPIQSSDISNPTEKNGLKNISREEMLLKRIESAKKKIKTINRSIACLSETEKKIVKMKYIEGKQWYKVAYAANYNERWCKEIRKRAIRKLAIAIFGDTALLQHFYSTLY